MCPAASSYFTGNNNSSPSSPPHSLQLLSAVTTFQSSPTACGHDSSMDDNHHDRHSDSADEASSSPNRPSKSSPRPSSNQHPRAAPPRPIPVREDCWSEEASQTLVDAWGERYLELKRGNLRQKHWQEVADIVNAAHGHTKRTRRTDIQCKNRIDTIKKKYKLEKARTLETRGYVSPWPFFPQLDALIGDTSAKKPVPQLDFHRRKPAQSPLSAPSPATPALALTWPVPVGPRTLKPKRPATMNDSSFLTRTFAAAAAAAPASSSDDEEWDPEEEEGGNSRSIGMVNGKRGRKRRRSDGGGNGNGNDNGGCRQLADAIIRFGQVYERVETMKQEQMVELEKHRMEFAKELEFQRMKLLVDTQLQLAKVHRSKPPSSNDDAADSY